MKLAIVEELVAPDTLEARHLEQQLREVRPLHLILAEQHDRGARHALVVDQQPQPTQDFQRFASTGVIHPAPADGLLQRQNHLAMVEPGGVPTLGGPILPAPGGVYFLQQQALVRVTRHRPRRVQYPLVGNATKRHRRPRAACHGERQYLSRRADGDPIYSRKQRRLKSLKLPGELFERAVADDLADYPSGWCHPEQQPPAVAVGEAAERAAGTVFFGGRLLKLDRLGFAGSG